MTCFDEPVIAIPPRRRASALVDVLGLFVICAAMIAMMHRFHDRVLIYDEGLLLTHAWMVSEGSVPFRDFYSVYPPGVYYLISGFWKLVGESVSAIRLLGFVIHAVIAVCAGRLAGLATGRRFSPLASGMVLLWLSPLALQPYAWLVAMGVGFVTACLAVGSAETLLASPERAGRVAPFGVGMMLGLVSAFRHDFFIYLVTGLLALLVIARLARRITLPQLVSTAAPLMAGTAAVVLLVWVPTLVFGGVDTTMGDLYFNLSRYVMPGREHSLTLDGPTPISVVMSGMLLCLAAPLVSTGLAWLARDCPRQLVAMLFLGVLSLASFPQMLRRFDGWHILYAAPPAVALFSALAERFAAKTQSAVAFRGPVTAALMLFLAWPIIPRASEWARLRLPPFRGREAGMPAYQLEWKREVLAFIASHSGPGEPIFVGNSQHRRANFNDLTLYYLAERPGATRYLQFDPGQVTRAEVQHEMIAQLEARSPKVVVLLEGGYSPEPNESLLEGATLLDDYIQSRYEVVGTSGVYRMLLRRR